MWTNPPAGTMSFAITFTDKSTGFSADYAHWTIFDIPAATTGLPEGVASGATAMPAPAKQSTNSAFLAPTNGYSGPCGTNTTPNPYELKLWALDVATLPDVTSSSARDAVLTALNAHDLGTATLTVTSTAP
jgi:Raf kinase inhibitor-like YbhB/YbcL family protein